MEVKGSESSDLSSLPNTPIQMNVSAADGIRLQARYYEARRLRAISFYGGELRVVRRDLFDGMERLRIRIYYDVNGAPVLTEFVNEESMTLASVPALLYFAGRGQAY
jgi:hypothetical protein